MPISSSGDDDVQIQFCNLLRWSQLSIEPRRKACLSAISLRLRVVSRPQVAAKSDAGVAGKLAAAPATRLAALLDAKIWTEWRFFAATFLFKLSGLDKDMDYKQALGILMIFRRNWAGLASRKYNVDVSSILANDVTSFSLFLIVEVFSLMTSDVFVAGHSWNWYRGMSFAVLGAMLIPK